MKEICSRVVNVILVLTLLIGIVPQALAVSDVTGGFAGISSYSRCSYGNRAGKQYVNQFDIGLERLDSSGKINYTKQLNLVDNNVTSTTISNANRATIFAFAGHGIKFDENNNAMHLNATSGGDLLSHEFIVNKHYNPEVNLKTTNTIFPHKYVVLYTCNQLTNTGSAAKSQNIINMMNGTRLMLGFASQMYLDSREAIRFCYSMNLMTICDAYIDAAEYYQVQRSDASTIARIVGYTLAENDKISDNKGYAPKPSASSYFDIITTVTISHTGQAV